MPRSFSYELLWDNCNLSQKKILRNEKSYVCQSCYLNALPFPNDDFVESFDVEEIPIELNLN